MPGLSYQDLYDIGAAELPEDVRLVPGDVADLQLCAAAAMGDAILQEARSAILDLFFSSARGGKLDRLVRDRFGAALARIPESSATGTVSFARAQPGPLGTIPAGAVLETAANPLGQTVRVELLAAVAWAQGQIGTQTASARAQTAGADGNLAANVLTQAQGGRIVTPLFDASIVVSASSQFGGASAEESDPEYVERIQKYPLSLAQGTLEALESGAWRALVPQVRRVTVVEENDASLGQPTGIVSLYISDAQGVATPQMVADVRAVLPRVRAAGSAVNVIGAQAITQPVVVSLSLRPGTTVDTGRVREAVAASSRRLRIGQPWSLEARKAAVLAVAPEEILLVDETTPGGNVTPTANQLIVCTANDVTVG